jgi:hypothetical protein
MRRGFLAVLTSLFLVLQGSPGTQAQTSATQGATLLSQSYKKLLGSVALTDATLTGSAEWIVGSDNETGSAVFKTTGGAHRLDLVFRNGTRSEFVSSSGGVLAGNWVGIDGSSHPIANHNLMVDTGWFPATNLGNLISSSTAVLTYIGEEERNGASVVHISVSSQFPALSGDSAELMEHLSQAEIFIDPSTQLPASYLYSAHPDDNALLDIPIEIRYSDYRNVSGALIPFHVQKYMNNTLILDLQFQSVSLNTGITATQLGNQ